MDIDEFSGTLRDAEPPANLGLALQALWWDGHGDWERAHACVQADEADPVCAWVHAYLHRKEGDLSNAGYWYRRAGRPVASGPLEAEWQAIAASLLKA